MHSPIKYIGLSLVTLLGQRVGRSSVEHCRWFSPASFLHPISNVSLIAAEAQLRTAFTYTGPYASDNSAKISAGFSSSYTSLNRQAPFSNLSQMSASAQLVQNRITIPWIECRRWAFTEGFLRPVGIKTLVELQATIGQSILKVSFSTVRRRPDPTLGPSGSDGHSPSDSSDPFL